MSDSSFPSAFRPLTLGYSGLRMFAADSEVTLSAFVAGVRKATAPRVSFALLMAALSALVLPPWLAAIWVGCVIVWELALRPFLEDWLVAPTAARAPRTGFVRLALIHFIGGLGYTAFPVLTWMSGEALGMVLATAWICGSANHLFVYFAPNRLVLCACVIPMAAAALAAPFLAGGLTLTAAVAAVALAALILAAGMFGYDRRLLLGSLAKQAAARASAEQANAAKSQFLATMSHELRTPLNAIIGYAELIEEETGEELISQDAVKVRGAARQLLGVIDTILDLSKLETGGIALERERLPVAAVIEALRETTAPLALANRNTITFREATPLGEAEIDHRRLYQCLLQLISNAAKFTRDGAIEVVADRRVEANRATIVFLVSDTGIGISHEQQERIFEPFAQGEEDAARRFEGAGLGLTLVTRLARLMGGDVSCQSTPGLGSVFTLWVPAGQG